MISFSLPFSKLELAGLTLFEAIKRFIMP